MHDVARLPTHNATVGPTARIHVSALVGPYAHKSRLPYAEFEQKLPRSNRVESEIPRAVAARGPVVLACDRLASELNREPSELGFFGLPGHHAAKVELDDSLNGDAFVSSCTCCLPFS
jgi:hypothetical protein